MKVLTIDAVKKRCTVTRRGCWLWNDGCSNGYAVAQHAGQTIRVHRWMLAQTVGPLGDRLALHRCDTRSCVNPEHLYAGTARDNARDTMARFPGHTKHVGLAHSRKTYCKYGHRFTPENTRYQKRGGRVCLTCKRADDERRRRAKGAAVRGEYRKRDRARINPDAKSNGALFAQSPAKPSNQLR